MSLNTTKLKEKVRDIDFTNPTINRLVHYSNLLLEQSDFIKDNGVKDFSLFDSSNKTQTINPFINETFL